MKRFYSTLAALLLTGTLAHTSNAQTTVWRPFRPGLIYAYHAQPATTHDEVYTLRVDSAYAATGGDSVYAFNRLMRPLTTGSIYGVMKSRNNLFGATVRWQPGSTVFTLEARAEANVQRATSLELRPRAAVGSSWAANSQQTASLQSRSMQTIAPGVQDSVAIIILSGSPAQVIRLSRQHGLLTAPQWLDASLVGTSTVMDIAALPATFGQSYYSPARLFDVQVGDEFGYIDEDFMNVFSCYTHRRLRRVTGRTVNANNELVISYVEQNASRTGGGPTCGPVMTSTGPVSTGSWTLSLNSPPSWNSAADPLQLAALGLLTYEYAPFTFSGIGQYTLMGLPLQAQGFGTCPVAREVRYVPMYGATSGNGGYNSGVDLQAWQHSFAPGMSKTTEMFHRLTYSRRTVSGQVVTCGTAQDFANLLSNRAVQAAAAATLAPNPATDQATLTFMQPLTKVATLTLADALGRRVWQGAVAAGQNSATVPLASQPAGLYLLQLQTGNAAPLTWKLTHE